jgi:hypothetical protein
MKKLALGIFFLSGLAMADDTLVSSNYVAKEVNFSYWSRWSAYSCDYVQEQATTFLKALGAIDIKVSCTGGLPYTSQFSSFITFDVLQPDAAGDLKAKYSLAQIKGNESCSFNVALLNEILRVLPSRSVHASNSCWESQGSYTYSLEVLN